MDTNGGFTNMEWAEWITEALKSAGESTYTAVEWLAHAEEWEKENTGLSFWKHNGIVDLLPQMVKAEMSLQSTLSNTTKNEDDVIHNSDETDNQNEIEQDLASKC